MSTTVISTTSPAALAVARRLHELRERLAATDLQPSAQVNAAFSELVELCCRTPPPVEGEVLRQVVEHAPSLRALCAAGECELERHWATRIVAARDPQVALRAFPYLANYQDLVRLELGALAAVGEPVPSRVVVLGAGPLPLTGMVLAADHGAHVVHVDRDAESLSLGTELMRTLGLGDRISSVHADLEDPAGREAVAAACREADAVVLAALVGADAPAKAEISRWLGTALTPGTPVLARSAAGLRTLLYPRVGPDDLPGLEVALEVHPRTDVVNSVLVARAGARVLELAG
ncbi:nicotianamine synthase family protein [Pseudonocardia bannensis]|uniref:Nicotianamine synthase n=1 Tax=Pseudonocardia bannensis TaxID=630973 RepID=A0A848DM55_9PSEU|nr:nicotianamine synthase family protein [Pseudonocardia bannensis]NMH93586.1 nicotianamine synthase [Pseudonocardia bannensis]